MAEAVRTTCPYCGTGCGVVMSEGRDGWAAGGDPQHPTNRGRLCSKGAALGELAGDQGRLLHPEVDGRRASWGEATAAVAARLRAVIAEHGPQAVAFYVSGQLLTEDYYVANKLLKGFVGSPHIDTNSRLCMASTVAGHKRAFGADVVPGCYEDLDAAELLVIVGSNLAWCHPVLHQRVRQARERGARVVVVDPRRTATCDDADLHLALAPGSDVTLFNGLLRHLQAAGALDRRYVAAHVDGLEPTLASAAVDAPSLERVAEVCDLAGDALARFYAWFAGTERVVTLFSQGVNQSAQGTDKVNAILNVHLASGRIGRPGMGPFSVTGQPNAMGGREVGGLANQLAAHLDPHDPADVARLRRFWKAPALRGGEGLKAVDLFRAVGDGRIKAVWIMATNPAVSLPEAGRVREALAACPLVIASDVVADSDSLRFAHIRLPASAWGEKDGTVTNSERRISRQRPFRRPPGEARPDWWIVCAVARALGFGRAFAYRAPVEIFREHAALSGFENEGRRAFDIGACARLTSRRYEALAPFQWPLPRGARPPGTARLFADGGFFTADGRARLVPVRRRAPADRPTALFPVVANSGRYRDQWHSMTRTGPIARLAAHRPEPLLEVHPRDAERFRLVDGGLARVANGLGDALLRVSVSEEQRPGEVFLPIHWTDRMAARAVVGRLVHARVDPLSGQPESKHAAVRLESVEVAWSGLLFTRRPLEPAGIDYWCRQAGEGCHVYELAGCAGEPPAWLGEGAWIADAAERLEYRDARRGVRRLAWVAGDRLEACLFLAPGRPAIARTWLQGLFAERALRPAARAVLLAGQAPGRPVDRGPLVCACLSVGLAQIHAVMRRDGAATTDELGRLLGAGTGCGSCLPELQAILKAGETEVGDAAA